MTCTSHSPCGFALIRIVRWPNACVRSYFLDGYRGLKHIENGRRPGDDHLTCNDIRQWLVKMPGVACANFTIAWGDPYHIAVNREAHVEVESPTVWEALEPDIIARLKAECFEEEWRNRVEVKILTEEEIRFLTEMRECERAKSA